MSTKTLDSLSGVVVVLAVAEGIVPFAAKAFGWTPIWSLPVRLDTPAWWVVSLVVLAVAVVAIGLLEAAKKRATG